MNSKVLIIDDEKDICFLISEILLDEKFITDFAYNSKEALSKFISYQPDLVILDVWLGNGDLDGIELLKKFKELDSSIPIIIISGHGTVDMAVNAIKNGAYDFLEKPFNSEKIIILSKRALESAKLINENKYLKKIANPLIPLVGSSNFIMNLNKNLDKISKSKSRVMITGPQGSGKRLIAQSINKHSIYSDLLANFIDFKNLENYEISNFFPKEKSKINENLLVKSNNRTLILDNIDYLPISFQKNLLTYLENDNFFSEQKINLNIKIISISSIDIQNEISKGNFMKSLFDRLNVISIFAPPISERRDDIIPISNYYLNYFNKNIKNNFSLSKNSINKLETYEWPGNIRQLINYIEKTIILNQDLNSDTNFQLDNLPIDMGELKNDNNHQISLSLSLKDAKFNFEKEYLLSQIKRFNGNMIKISEFTGMERSALYRKLKSLNILINN